jgi:heptosyltransferase-2
VARELQGQFDSAYILPNSLKSALVPWWAGIPKRVGYVGEARFGVLTHRVPNPPSGHRPPMVAFYTALATALQTNTTLTSLDLADNGIGAAVAMALATALQTNTTLTSLTLFHNDIGAAGATALATALQ